MVRNVLDFLANTTTLKRWLKSLKIASSSHKVAETATLGLGLNEGGVEGNDAVPAPRRTSTDYGPI